MEARLKNCLRDLDMHFAPTHIVLWGRLPTCSRRALCGAAWQALLGKLRRIGNPPAGSWRAAEPPQAAFESVRRIANAPSCRLLLSCAAGLFAETLMDETLMREIVRRVLTVARPDRIILFGSAATGQMTKDSDIDLLIVEPAPTNRHDESVAIEDAISDVNFPVDVKIIASERFEATKNIIGGIAYPAHKYGRVLYVAA
jgi:predicted nucleotidyltransferase